MKQKNRLSLVTVALVAAVGLLLGASTVTVQAQLGAPATLWSSDNYTASSPANTYCVTNALTLNTNTVDVSNFRYLGLTWYSKLTTSGTTTNTVLVERTTDGKYWTEYDRIATTSSGTTVVGYNTNYDLGGIGKLRITVLTAAPYTAPLTNSTLTILLKHGSQ